MGRLGSVFSSAERKATDAASLVADRFGLSPVVIAGLGENDRSATGYLPKTEFEAIADAFFARPENSVRGWERAIDAQRRIIAAMDRVIAQAPEQGDVAVVSHGGVRATPQRTHAATTAIVWIGMEVSTPIHRSERPSTVSHPVGPG